MPLKRHILLIMGLLFTCMLAFGQKKIIKNLMAEAETAYSAHNYNQLEEKSKSVLSLDSTNLRARIFLGISLNCHAQYSKSLTHLNYVLSKEPLNNEALSERGKAFYFLDDTVKALNDLTLLSTKSVRNSEGFFLKASIYYQHNNYSKALEALNTCINLDSLYANAYHLRAQCKDALNDVTGAMRDYSIEIKLQPDYFSYYLNGKSKYKQKNDNGAITDYSKAIENRPNDADPYYYRAITYLNTNKPDLALADLDKAINLNPALIDAYLLRAIANGNSHKNPEALADLNIYLEKRPENAEAWHFRGLANFNTGKRDLGCLDWRKALDMGWNESDYFLKSYCR